MIDLDGAFKLVAFIAVIAGIAVWELISWLFSNLSWSWG